MRFTNKVALITAAANGIGRATAEIMVREGATVIAVDNHQGRLEEAVASLKRNGRAEGRQVDALAPAEVDALVADVVRAARHDRHPGQRGRRQHGDRQPAGRRPSR